MALYISETSNNQIVLPTTSPFWLRGVAAGLGVQLLLNTGSTDHPRVKTPDSSPYLMRVCNTRPTEHPQGDMRLAARSSDARLRYEAYGRPPRVTCV